MALTLTFVLVAVSSCSSDDGQKDVIQIIKMQVSDQTSYYTPFMAPDSVKYEGMLVKEQYETQYWVTGIDTIYGFKYQKGYEYELLVIKRTLADPPQDASGIEYTLIKILSKKKK